MPLRTPEEAKQSSEQEEIALTGERRLAMT